LQGLTDLGSEALATTDIPPVYQLLVQPGGTYRTGLLLNGKVGFQGHGNPTTALTIILATLLGQIGRYAPDVVAHALHNASAAQGFQSAAMGGQYVFRITSRSI